MPQLPLYVFKRLTQHKKHHLNEKHNIYKIIKYCSRTNIWSNIFFQSNICLPRATFASPEQLQLPRATFPPQSNFSPQSNIPSPEQFFSPEQLSSPEQHSLPRATFPPQSKFPAPEQLSSPKQFFSSEQHSLPRANFSCIKKTCPMHVYNKIK